MALLDEKAIASLDAGAFEIHSLDLRLWRKGTPDVVLRGTGRIHQRGRQLWVTAYFPDQVGLPPFPETPPGQIIPEEEYCSLTALDEIGRRWSCERFLEKLTLLGVLAGCLLDCELPFLRGVDQLPRPGPKATFHGWLFRPLRLPANLATDTRTERGRHRSHSRIHDASEFPAAGFEFLVHSTDTRVSLSAQRDAGTLPARLGDRILESLEFVTAELLDWDASVESDGDEVQAYVRGDAWSPGRPRVSRPLIGGALDSGEDTWRLFDCYLRYVLQDRVNGRHRLSAEWRLVRQASLGTLQTEATISTAVVESLCRFLTAEESETAGEGDREREVREHRPAILKAVKACRIPKRLFDRIAGFLGSITAKPKPTDLLYQLASAGRLDLVLVEAWDELRDPSAHGDRKGQGDDPDLLLDCYRVLTLLYQLSFHVIAYQGPYTDYSQPGWPEGTYPPTADDSHATPALDD